MCAGRCGVSGTGSRHRGCLRGKRSAGCCRSNAAYLASASPPAGAGRIRLAPVRFATIGASTTTTRVRCAGRSSPGREGNGHATVKKSGGARIPRRRRGSGPSSSQRRRRRGYRSASRNAQDACQIVYPWPTVLLWPWDLKTDASRRFALVARGTADHDCPVGPANPAFLRARRFGPCRR